MGTSEAVAACLHSSRTLGERRAQLENLNGDLEDGPEWAAQEEYYAHCDSCEMEGGGQ